MSDRVLEIQSEGRRLLSYIPSGRQLPRTPPLMSVKKQLDFCSEDSSEELEEQADRDEDNQNATFDFNTFRIKSEPDDPSAMLRGMTGYQLTQTDSEFMENMREEKLVNELQGQLEALQRLFMKERTMLEQALVSRKKAQDGLRKLPSCDDIGEWVKVVLTTTSPSTDVTGLDAKSLLAVMVRKDIERVIDEKRVEFSRMKKRVANKRKKEPYAKGQLEKQVALEQLEIQGLMSHLSDLASDRAQQEEVYKALKLQLSAPEIPADEVDSTEDLRAAKRRATRGAEAVGATETSQDTTNQRKSTRSKLGDGRTAVKDEQASAPKTKTRSGAADQKERAGGPRQKAGAQESNSLESVRGRRKPPGSAAPLGKPQRPAGAGEALSSSLQGRKRAAEALGGEAQPPVLRRSKRIASRR